MAKTIFDEIALFFGGPFAVRVDRRLPRGGEDDGHRATGGAVAMSICLWLCFFAGASVQRRKRPYIGHRDHPWQISW